MFGSNSACTCATTRLLELRMFGVCQYIQTEKLKRLAANSVTWKMHANAVKQVLDSSDIADDDDDDEVNKYWQPVLYSWQVAAGDLDEGEDPGQLVFTDFTTTRYLVVNVKTCEGDDAAKAA
jgi:hypothetical protein